MTFVVEARKTRMNIARQENPTPRVKFLLRITALLCLLPALIASVNLPAEEVRKVHAMAMHGEPRYPEGFTHFDYVNPEASKGGLLRNAVVSSSGFDSLNPFIIKGASAAGFTSLDSGYFYESLTVHSDDEAFTQYGLIAEYIEAPADRSWVIFHINPQARFHDGHAITAEDVLWSFETLTTKGHPLYATYYQDVIKHEALDERRVKFSFREGDNRELALIMGQLPVLPKHYWQDRDFKSANLDIPVGSGPYMIKEVDPGRSITYVRNPDYWGKDLAVNTGMYNFNELQFDYYRDGSVAIEAFKSGDFDLRVENTAKNWATLYSGPQFERGDIVKAEIAHQLPTGMQAFVMNTRRPQFTDYRVRQALAQVFDFEWSNKNLFYNAYSRTHSYFSNSELAATDLPSPEELEILNKFKGQIPDQVFSTVYRAPATKGDGNIRTNIRAALKLLKEAGWEIRNKKLTNVTSGEIMKFEIMLVSPDFQRIVLPFKKNLSRLGIETDIRLVDTQQYINRVNSFDFDMIVHSMRQSSSPGNEQRDFWHSSQADIQGSRNVIGVKDPVVDALIDLIIAAPDREQLIIRTRALDRVLLWNHYVIPQWHIRHFRVAYWDKFARPKKSPKYGLGLDTWWQKSN